MGGAPACVPMRACDRDPEEKETSRPQHPWSSMSDGKGWQRHILQGVDVGVGPGSFSPEHLQVPGPSSTLYIH